jgi:uncharacterized protein YbjT (DUF2867 family)
MSPSVLVIGAGGNFGSSVINEFLKKKSSFGQIAILADSTRKEKFVQYKEHGINTVLGSYFDPAVYKG